MGRYYAEAAGESPGVARAIEEHYRPRFAGDELPSTSAGRSSRSPTRPTRSAASSRPGWRPKGSADPFALRRSAIGILRSSLAGLPLQLDELIADALGGYVGVVDGFDPDEVGAAVKAFFMARLEGSCATAASSTTTVAAVLAAAGERPADALARCEALARLAQAPPRRSRTCRSPSSGPRTSRVPRRRRTDHALMGEHEVALADALEPRASGSTSSFASAPTGGARGYAQTARTDRRVLREGARDGPDERLRANRLGLLARFVALFAGFADFSRLAG